MRLLTGGSLSGDAAMHLLSKILLLVFALILLTSSSLPAAWFWGEKPLCTIGGESYSAQDFKEWWEYYQDEGSSFPEDPDPFIEWQLLVKEAERMGLYKEPSFQRKVGMFLKVRSLLLLKNEEIDAKINLTPDLIRAHYEEEYCPQYYVELLFFHDEQLAAQSAADLRSGHQTMEYYKRQSNIHGGGIIYQEQLLGPKNINQEWLKTVAAMEVGDVSSPQLWEEGYVIFRLESKIWFDEADFEKQKEAVTRELIKIQKAKLTALLIDELKEKYHVVINDDLFATLDPYALDGASGEAILIATSKGDITVNQFLAQVRKGEKFFKKFDSGKEEREQLKQRVLHNILSQALTSWAALDRHYERKPPLQEVYRYYRQHLLIKELEKRIFEPEVIVSPEEVELYYRQHEGEFTQLAKVRIASMEYSGEQIDRIWSEIIMGSDFGKVAEKYTGRPVVETEQFTEQLAPAYKEVIERLSPGEISPPFINNSHWLIVKLINQQNTRVEPLAEAAGRISAMLKQEKFTRVRATFLDLLKTKVSIIVNENAWQTLKEEMAE